MFVIPPSAVKNEGSSNTRFNNSIYLLRYKFASEYELVADIGVEAGVVDASF